MFGTTPKEPTDFEKEQERIDAELEAYRKIRKKEIDLEIDKQLAERKNKLVDFEKKCYEQLGDWEHEFHQKKEDDRVELAKVEGRLLEKKEHLESYQKLLDEKDAEIRRLTNFVNKLMDKDVVINNNIKE